MADVARRSLSIGLLLAMTAGAFADPPDPARLVRDVRQRESWIERVESLQLKAEIRWERTPRGVEHRRRKLRKQFPDADLGKFRDLYFHTSQIVELAFPADATWLNSKPLSKQDLAGKIVILDFWAEWCGPCRNDLPALAALHKKQAKDVVVIGVHPPGSDLDAIKKLMKDFELEHPICIDVAAPKGASTWGALYESYGVNRIPHSVVIDGQGKIAATGALGDVLAKAAELAGRGL